MGNVLLVGGTGFLGGWMIRCAPASVPRASILTAGRATTCDTVEGTHVAVDLRAEGAVEDLVVWAKPSAVFLLAGTRRAAYAEMLALHVGVTTRLLRSVSGKGTRVIVVGSSAELGASDGRRVPLAEDAPESPTTPYGQTKAAQAEIARAFAWSCPIVRARLFNLVGPGLSEGLAPADLAKQVVEAERARGRIVVGRTDSVRDFLDVRDAAEALWRLALSTETGLFHVGSGKGTRIGDLAAMLLAEAKGPCSLVEKETQRSPSDVDWQVADNGKIRSRLGWEPRIPLAQSVRDMLDALRGRA